MPRLIPLHELLQKTPQEEGMSDPDRANRDDRFGEIVFAYLQAHDRGESPTEEDVIAQHPEFAAELRGFFEDARSVDGLSLRLRSAVSKAIAKCDTITGGIRPGCAEEVTLDADRTVGDFELLEELGRGGMGIVYKARQQSLHRLVAVKMLRVGRLASGDAFERFRNEAKALATVDHPNILPIYEIGKHRGRPYFAFKLVEGGSLAEHLAEYRRQPRRTAELIVALADAIHHAHSAGMLHLDLKPSNVLLGTQGQPYLTDFGLAQPIDGSGDRQDSQEVTGTPSYMAPEQIAPGKTWLSSATDVYGLGGVLYSLLTGSMPFRDSTVSATLQRVLHQAPTPPRQLNPHADPDLEAICLKCLAKDPLQRYACCGELKAELGRWLAGEPVRARPLNCTSRICRWVRRNPLASVAATVIAMLLAAFLLLLALGKVRVEVTRVADAARCASCYPG